jgi:hypothetical protein
LKSTFVAGAVPAVLSVATSTELAPDNCSLTFPPMVGVGEATGIHPDRERVNVTR